MNNVKFNLIQFESREEKSITICPFDPEQSAKVGSVLCQMCGFHKGIFRNKVGCSCLDNEVVVGDPLWEYTD